MPLSITVLMYSRSAIALPLKPALGVKVTKSSTVLLGVPLLLRETEPFCALLTPVRVRGSPSASESLLNRVATGIVRGVF